MLICSLPAHRHTGRNAQLYPRLQPACTQTYRPRCSTVSQTAACLHTDIQAEMLNCIPDCSLPAHRHTDRDAQLYPRLQPVCTQTYRPRSLLYPRLQPACTQTKRPKTQIRSMKNIIQAAER